MAVRSECSCYVGSILLMGGKGALQESQYTPVFCCFFLSSEGIESLNNEISRSAFKMPVFVNCDRLRQRETATTMSRGDND